MKASDPEALPKICARPCRGRENSAGTRAPRVEKAELNGCSAD
jgi:hypothetical protein